jgi:hypothetical protein
MDRRPTSSSATARAPALERLAAGLDVDSEGGSRPRRRYASRRPGSSCCRASRRHSASPTSRRWRRRSRDRDARRARAAEIAPAAGDALVPAGDVRRWARDPTVMEAAGARRRRARERRATHPGTLRARHRGGVRGGAAMKPVLFVTNTRRRPRGRVRALHERENVHFALIGGGVRGGGAADRAPFPCASAGARRRASPRPDASRRVAGVRPRRASAAYAGARQARPVRPLGDDWRHPPGARALLPPAPPPLPPRGRDRHLRSACPPTCG